MVLFLFFLKKCNRLIEQDIHTNVECNIGKRMSGRRF